MAAKTTIVVNGVEYASVTEMPPDVRSQYDSVSALLADRDGNGIPDLVEAGAGAGALTEALGRLPRGSFTTATERWVVSHEQHGSLESLPAGLRSGVRAVGRTPDGGATRVAGRVPSPPATQRLPAPEERPSNLGSLLIGLLVALLALIAFGVVELPG
jgi:hypothetical protein